MSECIPVPKKKDWEDIALKFWNIWNFPNCIGAIDGKHIEIVAPHNSGSHFFNYKKTFSVVLLALVDANYKFVAIDIGSYGKNSDGGILANSKLGRGLENRKLDIPEAKFLLGTNVLVPHVIIGDAAFPLKTYLMRPYSELQANNDLSKRIFNYRLCRARRIVENAFGILAQKFRIYFRKINSQPGNVENIILTTCILHNFLRGNNTSIPPEALTENPNEQGNIFNDLPRQGGNAQRAAFNVRETLKIYFNSEIGAVPWQNNHI